MMTMLIAIYLYAIVDNAQNDKAKPYKSTCVCKYDNKRCCCKNMLQDTAPPFSTPVEGRKGMRWHAATMATLRRALLMTGK